MRIVFSELVVGYCWTVRHSHHGSRSSILPTQPQRKSFLPTNEVVIVNEKTPTLLPLTLSFMSEISSITPRTNQDTIIEQYAALLFLQ